MRVLGCLHRRLEKPSTPSSSDLIKTVTTSTLGFCDIHNHTLPGVDDGARNLDSSLRMLRISLEEGVSTIALTPHSRVVRPQLKSGLLECQLEALRELAARESIPIEFSLAMEVFLEPNLAQLYDEGLIFTIGKRYMLIESPYTKALPVYTDDVLLQLQTRGLTPIIGHPERCDAFIAKPELLRPMVERGMLVQITAGSIHGRFGDLAQKTAHRLLRDGLVHIIASDGHHSHGARKPLLAEGVEAAGKIVGRERALAMASTTPRGIVEGKPRA